MRKILLSFVTAAAVLAPIAAEADVVQLLDKQVSAIWNFLGSEPPTGAPDAVARPDPTPLAARDILTPALGAVQLPETTLAAAATPPAPSVETPLHRLFCVEYARARSGLAVFGDAKFWWERARNLYARVTEPVENAVIVFSGSKRLSHGHVAVVTAVLSDREIRVDQANWENHGEIDHSTPVKDVSVNNDWSRVRVWDRRSQGFGTHVYAISGFIAKGLVQQASRD